MITREVCPHTERLMLMMETSIAHVRGLGVEERPEEARGSQCGVIRNPEEGGLQMADTEDGMHVS